MSLFKIALRSIQQRGLSSAMTALSMALGVALVTAVLVFQHVIEATYRNPAQGYNIIIGPKGGRLELVLNTVFHIGQPVGIIPWDFYKEFTPEGVTGRNKPGRYSSVIDAAVPYCLGDNYEGFRVVGTTTDMFRKLGYIDSSGELLEYRTSAGAFFEPDDYFGAVVGAVAAKRAGLVPGGTFEPVHGVTGEEGHKHDPFVVRGILAPTGTPNDRAIFINMEGFFLLEGHAEELPPEKAAEAKAAGPQAGTDPRSKRTPLPEAQRMVSAILVRFNEENMTAPITLPRSINKGNIAQAVSPAREVTMLFEGILGNLQYLLIVLAVLICVVAGVGILVSIYNSMNDRRREIAVMRALGAGRQTVMAVILLEAVLISVAGGVVGFLLGHGLIGLLSGNIGDQTGVPIGFTHFAPVELWLVPGLIVLAVVAGFLPAMSAYRTDVAKALTAAP